MKAKPGAAILTGVFLLSTVLPATVLAGPGQMRAKRQTLHSRTQARTWNMAMTQDQLRDQIRLRDGSCNALVETSAATMNPKKGNTYGPGDGDGDGIPNLDGTGYGPGLPGYGPGTLD